MRVALPDKLSNLQPDIEELVTVASKSACRVERAHKQST